jgi:hypothetical protein
MKSNIAILVCGQIRNSNLGNDLINCTSNKFANSFKNCILNSKNIEEHNINIFFSVDNINANKLNYLCGNNLKGIVETDYESIANDIDLEELKLKHIEYHNNRKNNHDKFPLCTPDILESQITMINKFYKVYSGLKLMLNYENNHNFRHDYILLLRPDNFFSNSIDFTHIISTNFELLTSWDVGFFGNYKIMIHLCSLIKYYGFYNLGEILYSEEYVSRLIPNRQINTDDILYKYYTYPEVFYCWSESPEVQIVEHILKYCIENDIHFEKLNSTILFSIIFLNPDRK